MAAAMKTTSTRWRWRAALWGGAAALLLVPAVAMQFSDEVRWGPGSFLVMGTLLAILCGLIELGARLGTHWAYRLGFALAALAGFTTVWVNLAVGMIGGEDDPRNFVFVGVLLIAAIGALWARFRAAGMAHAMFATALAMAGTTLLAARGGEMRVALLMTAWIVAWSIAALLFQVAARASADARA
jgi:hypothetical protein